jgi:hypothetical protein
VTILWALFNNKPINQRKAPLSIARNFMGRNRSFSGNNLEARGYFVSTVGLDEEVVKKYIREQEKENERLEHLKFGYREKDEKEEKSQSGDSWRRPPWGENKKNPSAFEGDHLTFIFLTGIITGHKKYQNLGTGTQPLSINLL